MASEPLIPSVVIEVIPHAQQRYETVGDWWFDEGGTLQIRVSQMGEWRSEMAVATHELSEAIACREAGIPEPVCMAFDIEYERKRKPGDNSEPGDAPNCPYGPQHKAATAIERQFVESHGLTWKEHEARVNAL